MCANRCGRCGSSIRQRRRFCGLCLNVRDHNLRAERKRNADKRFRPTEEDYAHGVAFDQQKSGVPGELFAPNATRGGWCATDE